MIIREAKRIGGVQEYYFSRKLKEIAAMKAAGREIINLGIGSPDLPPHPVVIQRLQETAAQKDVHGYQSYIGRTEMRHAFASWYWRIYEVTVDPDQEILPLMGSKEGIMHLHMAFIDPGDQVLIPDPGYPTYAASARLAGAEIITYNLREEHHWQPDWDDLNQKDWSRVKMCWINYPHMPTGAIAEDGTFERWIELAHKHQFLIVHDNPYSHILNPNPQSILEIPGAKEVCIELASLSKSLNMAGWRVGCMVGGADYLTSALKFKSNMDSGMFAPLQLAAVEALSLDEQWYEELNTLYTARKRSALDIMRILDVTCDPDGVGMFVWGKIPNRYSDGFAYSDSILNQTGIFITPGGIFGRNGEQYLRISLCAPEETFQRAVQTIESQLTQLNSRI